MGKKTDKKIKSDRINILRKQYDAFLEEDKKRKDRNEYILGRLDNMRYSSTAVQPHTYSDYFAPSYNRHANKPDNLERNNMQLVHMNQQTSRPSYHNLQLDIARNFIEETSILKEISKKYILIPKLGTNIHNDVPEVILPSAPMPVSSVKATDIDNNDWKSKYDILDQLKTKEKDDEASKYAFNDRNNQDKPNDHVMHTYTREELPTRYEEEMPEKDVSDQLLVENELKNLEKITIHDKMDQIPSTDVARSLNVLSLNPENSTSFYDKIQNEGIGANVPQVHKDTESYLQPEHYAIPAGNIVEAISQIDNNQYQENYPEQELQPEQQYPIEYEQFMPNTEADTNNTEPEKVINHEENDYSPIEVLNPDELVEELNKDNIVREVNETENEYSAEIANTQEFTTVEETAVLQDGQGINPENYMTDDGTIVQGNPVPQVLTEDPTDTSGIEEFDAEQREMFYSEQAGENYAYDEHGATGDAYNTEYAQNQNYAQNQEYAYYEGAEQEEGAYPTEINEHEETQQLYDQHYEQQYTTNYEQDYEQQAVYMEQDPSQPQFEQPALYDQAQRELEQYTDDLPAETQEQVERVLDREDGYIEKRVEDPTAQENKQTAELTVS